MSKKDKPIAVLYNEKDILVGVCVVKMSTEEEYQELLLQAKQNLSYERQEIKHLEDRLKWCERHIEELHKEIKVLKGEE